MCSSFSTLFSVCSPRGIRLKYSAAVFESDPTSERGVSVLASVSSSRFPWGRFTGVTTEVVGGDSFEMDLAFRGGFFRVRATMKLSVEAPDMDVTFFRVAATTVFPREDGVTPSLVGEHLLEMIRPFFGMGLVLESCILIFLRPFRRGDNELFLRDISSGDLRCVSGMWDTGWI